MVRPLILVSRADPASVTIRDVMLEMVTWEEVGAWHGLPVRRAGEFLLVETEALHLDCDGIDGHLKAAGFDHDVILFPSKHRSESGSPALTVHPIGNWGEADFGGKPGRVSPTAPAIMGRIFRRLVAEVADIKHAATFEATHHGPYVETAAAFVEVGTDEAAWRNRDLARRVARAMLACLTPQFGDDAPTLIMVGGGHYAPRVNDLVKAGKANFGHILPGYALTRAAATPSVLLEAIAGTPRCAGYYLDPRNVEQRPDEILDFFAGLELGWWTEDDLSGRNTAAGTV